MGLPPAVWYFYDRASLPFAGRHPEATKRTRDILYELANC